MKKLTKDWILLADGDLCAAEIILNDESHLTNICAFHCQQAIEKYMKAYLIEKSIPLIKTHDLIKLNGMISEVENIGIDEKKLFAVNEIYIETRYPGELGLVPSGMPTNEEVNRFLEYAKEIKTIICQSL